MSDHPLIYLDNAATSYPKPEVVYQAVMHAMCDVGASPGRGGYRRSLEASRILYRTREAAAELFSIQDSSRIIFTHSATESLNMALRGVLNEGDHVVTTSMEHNSLLRPLYAHQKQGGGLTIVPAGTDGLVDPDDIRRALTGRTRLIALGHISNVCGAIQPVDEIAAIARQAGALFLLDAAQSAGNERIDVSTTGIDLMAMPGHKGLLGPQGTGLLYVAPQVKLRPLLYGGTGTHARTEDQPDIMPDGFEAGTHNLPGIAGLGAGIGYILERGVDAIAGHERGLIQECVRRLTGHPGIHLHGPNDPSRRGSVLSLTFDAIDPGQLAGRLDHEYTIAVRSGLHCAPLAHTTIGTFPHGTLRVSPGLFSTGEDVAMFCDAVIRCLQTV